MKCDKPTCTDDHYTQEQVKIRARASVAMLEAIKAGVQPNDFLTPLLLAQVCVKAGVSVDRMIVDAKLVEQHGSEAKFEELN